MWATLVDVNAPAHAWCREATRRDPQLTWRVTSFYARADGRVIEEVDVRGPGWGSALAALRKAPRVSALDVIETRPEGALIRIESSGCALPAAIEASGVMPRLPFPICGGCDRWLLVGDPTRVRTFLTDLGTAGIDARVVRSGEHAPREALTPRQRQVLDHAVAHGYYEYPRRTTLSRMAGELGIAKSTLSQTLMLIERALVARDRSAPGSPE